MEFSDEEMMEIEMFDLPDRGPGESVAPKKIDGCDGCGFDVAHDHLPGDRPFTFVLWDGDDYGDELDVYAANATMARALATLVVTEVYDSSGGTELRSMPLGGSGGWVVIS